MAIIHGLIDPIVMSALERKREGKLRKKDEGEGIQDEDTLLDHLVRLTDGE